VLDLINLQYNKTKIGRIVAGSNIITSVNSIFSIGKIIKYSTFDKNKSDIYDPPVGYMQNSGNK
jgi:hypothetical protein